jgi:hypothetical protein
LDEFITWQLGASLGEGIDIYRGTPIGFKSVEIGVEIGIELLASS